jgi:hypothetical protein
MPTFKVSAEKVMRPEIIQKLSSKGYEFYAIAFLKKLNKSLAALQDNLNQLPPRSLNIS